MARELSFPWGGVLAILLLVAGEHAAFGRATTWRALRDRVDGRHALEKGLVRDELERRLLRAAPPDIARVAVLGSSRARHGVRPELLPSEAARGLRVASLAHAWMQPVEIHSTCARLLDDDPDLVVLLLSEYATHRSLRIRPQATRGGTTTIAVLVRELGAAHAWRERTALMRTALVGVVESYRLRDVLHYAFTHTWRRFELPAPRYPRAPRRDEPGWGAAPLSGAAELAAATSPIAATRFADVSPTVLRQMLDQAIDITRGPHAEVKLAMVASTIERLRAAGVRVVLAEAPIHELARPLYDPVTTREFRAFARESCARFDARFVGLDALPTFTDEDFADILHLAPDGAAKLTRALLDVAREELRR